MWKLEIIRPEVFVMAIANSLHVAHSLIHMYSCNVLHI